MATSGRSQWRAVWSRSQTSFILGVALVPAFVAEIARGVDATISWYWMALVLFAGILVFFGISWVAARRQSAPLPHDNTVRGLPVDEIQHLVVSADAATLGGGQRAIHTLVKHLPNLEYVSLVLGDDQRVPPEEWSTELRTWLDHNGFDKVRLGGHQFLAVRDVNPAQIDTVTDWLTGLRPTPVTVDITGGSAAMSIALFLAARAANLQVTYTSTTSDATQGGRPGQLHFVGLIEISTPQEAAA